MRCYEPRVVSIMTFAGPSILVAVLPTVLTVRKHSMNIKSCIATCAGYSVRNHDFKYSLKVQNISNVERPGPEGKTRRKEAPRSTYRDPRSFRPCGNPALRRPVTQSHLSHKSGPKQLIKE